METWHFLTIFIAALSLQCTEEPANTSSITDGDTDTVDNTDTVDDTDTVGDTDSGGDTISNGDGYTDGDTEDPAVQWELAFSPPSGTFSGTLQLEIVKKNNTAGEIHFTTDGTAPTISAPVYSGPITITASTEVNAAIFDGNVVVAEGAAVYVPRGLDLSLDLPILIVDNFGAGELRDEDRSYVRSVFLTFDTRDGIARISNPADTGTRAGIHIRGQSSSTFEKRPYRVELRDRFDEDLDWPVLGMPAESDWVLRGPYVDKALIRDAFHYDLGRDIGMEAPRYSFIELYTNFDGDALEAEDYQGVYMIAETIKNAKNRLDLKQLHAQDTDAASLPGGYIFKFEWQAVEEPILDCPGNAYCWTELEIVDPSDINIPQKEWLAGHLYEFSQALHTSTLNHETNGYGQYIDATSFADQIIMNEIGREADAYIRSAYFYKDRLDVIHAGPLWDYNLALGTGFDLFGLENLATSGWMYEVNATRDNPSNDWFFTMLQDPAFQTLLRDRWRELRQGPFSDTALNQRIDALSAPLVSGAIRNFERWPNLNTANIGYFQSPVSNTWEEQVVLLRSWLMERTAWMDSQWN